jgi:hypothetical protein
MEALDRLVPLAEALPECDPRIAELHRYWCAITPADRRMPGRRQFDPTAIPKLLPWLRLYEVHRDPLRFRYRVVGTELVRIMGRDPTGKWLHETFPGVVGSHEYDMLISVAGGATKAYSRGVPVLVVPKDYLLSERLTLPLAGDGEIVDMVLAITIHHPVKAAAA